MNTPSIKAIVGLLLLITLLCGLLYVLLTSKWKHIPFLSHPTVITEQATIPETSSIGGVEGFYPSNRGYHVPLAPKDESERVIVEGAMHSPYTSYELVRGAAGEWSQDAQLALIKSLGTVTLDGISIGWQLIFISPSKKSGYEIIVERGAIVRRKEVPTEAKGGVVPENFKDRDASWAISKLSENPQWKEATMSGLNLTYNADAKAWDYVIAHSYGGSSVRIR